MNNDTRNTASENSVQETIFAPFTPDEESPYIFISYAHKDRDRVFPIITRLYEQGWRVWYDEGIPISKESDYLDSLAKHISECAIVVAMVTNVSVTRKFVTEKELEYACGDADRRVIFCYLDSDAVLPRSIQLLTAKRDKYPRTDEAGLEAALENIEGLTKTAPRKAKGLFVKSVVPIVSEEDEYDFEQCKGGVRLTKYNGSEENVEIPETYKGQPVVELYSTFLKNETVRTVRVPATVRNIGWGTFVGCKSMTDVYIYASVREIYEEAFGGSVWGNTYCTVHCAKSTTAHKFAEKKYYLAVIIDNSLNVTKTIQNTVSDKYAFCSYAEDKQAEAERIIAGLVENGCNIVFSNTMTDAEKLDNVLKAECVIAFISQGYINGSDILYLRSAKNMGRNYIIYALDNSALPDDMNISISAEQQLRYDNGTEQDRLKKLINLLSDSGCIKTSADMPDYEYTTDTDGNIILTKYTGKDTDVNIPGSHAGHIVTSISKIAFDGNSSLIVVNIPDSVTSIGERAFTNCSSLTTVNIPDGVTSIERMAFSNCSSLTAVNIPDSVKSIGDAAFRGCSSLTAVNIPDSVTSIDHDAFEGCSSLTAIFIPDSVTSIGNGAFRRCSNLKELKVSSDNKKYCSVDGVLMSKDKKTLIAFPAGLGGKYSIPDSVTSISNYAFSGCSSLNAVNIPDSVTSIGHDAFERCSSLTAVNISSSVTSIYDYAFYKCSSLTAVNIPNSVTSISWCAFSGCSSLTAVNIPDSVISIGDGAFNECSNLTVVTILNSVTSIGDGAFEKCSSLTSINIPDSVTSIGFQAFRDCTSLTAVTIPSSIKSIGIRAFDDCDKLTVYCSEGSAAWQYCEEEKIPHKPLEQSTETHAVALAPAEKTEQSPAAKAQPAEASAPSPAPSEKTEPAPASIAKAQPAEPVVPAPAPKKRRSLAPLFILLALLAAAVGVQLSGLFDILGWLGGLLG